MHIKIPHRAGSKQAAVEHIKKLLSDGRAQLKDQATINEERWEGETLHFDVSIQGQRISGQLQVEDTEFVLDANLPLMLRIFEGRIEREIAEQVKKLGA